MNKVKTIELSADAANELLPLLEGRLESLFQRVEDAQSEYKRTEKTIAELKLKLNGSHEPVVESKRKRKKKGQSEKAIAELLASGTGFKIKEVSDRTGIPYSTVFRIFKKKNKGRWIEESGVWKIAPR